MYMGRCHDLAPYVISITTFATQYFLWNSHMSTAKQKKEEEEESRQKYKAPVFNVMIESYLGLEYTTLRIDPLEVFIHDERHSIVA